MTKKQKGIIIRNPHELKIALFGKESAAFALMLNGGAFSRKVIGYTSGKFYVTNCIDDSEQVLTEKSIMDKKRTNIGIGMKRGSFVLIPHDI